MLKPTHVATGAAVALASVVATGGYVSPFLAFFPFLALLDDADHHSSSITKALGLRLPGAKHRGYSHSILFNVVVGAVIYFAVERFFKIDVTSLDFAILLAVSCSHILGDFFTLRGVPLLYPLTDRNFGIPLMSTGNMSEKLGSLILSLANLGLLGLIATKFAVPGALVVGSKYPSSLIVAGLVVGGLTLVVLLKEETTRVHKDFASVVSSVWAFFFAAAANVAVIYGLSLANERYALVDFHAVAASLSVPYGIFVYALAVAAFLPTVAQAFRSIDKAAFPLANATNVIVFLGILAGMAKAVAPYYAG